MQKRLEKRWKGSQMAQCNNCYYRFDCRLKDAVNEKTVCSNQLPISKEYDEHIRNDAIKETIREVLSSIDDDRKREMSLLSTNSARERQYILLINEVYERFKNLICTVDRTLRRKKE